MLIIDCPSGFILAVLQTEAAQQATWAIMPDFNHSKKLPLFFSSFLVVL
jgi:hypothetical protein